MLMCSVQERRPEAHRERGFRLGESRRYSWTQDSGMGGRGDKAKDPENQAWEFKPNGMEQSDRVDITKINLVAEDVEDSRQGEQLG